MTGEQANEAGTKAALGQTLATLATREPLTEKQQLKARVAQLEQQNREMLTTLAALGTRGIATPDGGYATTVARAELARVQDPNTHWDVRLEDNPDRTSIVLVVRATAKAAPQSVAPVIQFPR